MISRRIAQWSAIVACGAQRRMYSGRETVRSFFELFPKTFPKAGPPRESFIVDQRKLRKELRSLQGQHHPDVAVQAAVAGSSEDVVASDDGVSALLNKAYSTLRNPYTRIAHIIQVNHPEHLDITEDDVSKALIAKFSSQSDESSLEYKSMLMSVMEAHEALEFAGSEEDIEGLEEENNAKILESEQIIESLLQKSPPDWDALMMEAIKLKYWININNAVKEWEPGKPVNLTH
ncbi:Piso0_000837 [Millerozyma farinosa CBS 7064]|uniref:Piso0_000837 protein n=1 Tax=Pichia sorbitophila (strain ATCC MYA-4447 / BCRC 22081 / CBS 7064 / NBRC 10061 / NRRL Y-12695) TaxID=559304 RepID=G8YRN3_PICSO|nr:Piso0_000837 [Millerozyma farinosa CBS 7064]